MSIKNRIGIASLLTLTLAACGSNDATDDAGTIYVPPPGEDAAISTPGPDAAVTTPGIDAGGITTPVETEPLVWVVIQDTEQTACTTNGPGSDIDAVAKLAADGTVLGWGTNATYKPNTAFACENEDCNGKNCKYAANSKTFPLDNLVKRTEGKVDGQVNDVGDDIGYFSLNAGTLSIQIGNLNGTGVAQELKSGDWIAVYEVDKSYITAGAAAATCICAPEHYTVKLQSQSGKRVVDLKPAVYSPDNTACALTASSIDGCGSTTFAVP